jgi:hypothetical protein
VDRDAANAPRLDVDVSAGHYESWFIRANHPERPLAFWIRYTLYVPRGQKAALGGSAPRLRPLAHGLHPGPSGRPHAELFAIWFDGVGHRHVSVRETFQLADCQTKARGLAVRFGGSTLDDDGAIGSARTRSHAIGWDLAIEGGAPPLLLLEEERYAAAFPKAKSLVPRPLARFRGEIEVDGERHTITDWLGSQNHNWGERHTDAYAWGQVAGFDGADDAFFECGSGRVKVGGIWSPPITLFVLRAFGEELALTKLTAGLRAKAAYALGRFELSGVAGDALVRASFEAPVADLVGLAYDNPPGGAKTCINTKIASAKVTVTRRGSADLELVASRRAALEILTDETVPAVAVLR